MKRIESVFVLLCRTVMSCNYNPKQICILASTLLVYNGVSVFIYRCLFCHMPYRYQPMSIACFMVSIWRPFLPPSNMVWVRFSIINWECRLFRFLSLMVVRNICGSIFLQSSPSHSFSTNIMGGHYIDFSSFSSNRKMNAASFGREKKCCFLAGKMKNCASVGY